MYRGQTQFFNLRQAALVPRPLLLCLQRGGELLERAVQPSAGLQANRV